MVKVLVVEDDVDTAEEIMAEFASAGMEARHELTGPDGLQSAQTGDFDVITLDRMLPQMDGLTVLDRLRGFGIQTPVLVLSALSSVDERIRGLRAGGDDYLTKPFVTGELRARVEALARRTPDKRMTSLKVDDLELDLLTREARRGTRPLDLFPREFKLLEFLVRHAGHVLTRAMLFEQVWGYRFDPGTNLVDVHIGRLRRKVDEQGETPLIHTVRGAGFVLRAPIELLRTTAFRWTLGIAGILALSILLMGGFFYWQTVVYLTGQVDRSLTSVAQTFALEPRGDLTDHIRESLLADPRRLKAFGLFDAEGKPLAGNLDGLPVPLPAFEQVQEIEVSVQRQTRIERLTVRAIAKRLPNGDILLLGRVIDELQEIRDIVTRAMALAVLPTAILALVGGAAVSIGTLRRVEAVRRACLMIMEGHLDRRLPVRSKKDEFDRLSEIVNRMLDDIERLVMEVQAAGDAIAHDVRTPLTRLRARLERALKTDIVGTEVPALLEKSTADIDQLLSTVTAILRIAEVEQGRRRSGFAAIDLDEILTAVTELYAPIAEEKSIALSLDKRAVPRVCGDGELLFEVFGNLLDNAVKFTPPGGRVDLVLRERAGRVLVIVRDTGPGIPWEEREAVLRRFYRGDRSRSQPGTGLGLSLVAAIVRLHGFDMVLSDPPGGGCEVTLLCEADSHSVYTPAKGVGLGQAPVPTTV